MKKISETIQISDLLNSTIFGELSKNNKIDFILKQSTLFSFWEDIVGKKFIKFTKPYVIKGSKIFVSVKSPVLVQELSLHKNILLKKINSYSAPLGINIKEIVFDYKNFEEKVKSAESEFVEDKPVEIKLNDLEKICLQSETIGSIEQIISKIKFLNDEQKQKFAKKILNNIKAKSLQEKK